MKLTGERRKGWSKGDLNLVTSLLLLPRAISHLVRRTTAFRAAIRGWVSERRGWRSRVNGRSGDEGP